MTLCVYMYMFVIRVIFACLSVCICISVYDCVFISLFVYYKCI